VLAADLRLSPGRLAEQIERLAREGFVLESHPMLGVRLLETPAALRAEELLSGRADARVGRAVRCEAAAASTNDEVWKAADAGPGAGDGLVVFAEHQTAGRGRRGSRWLAPPHSSVLCSVVLWMPDAARQGAVLTRAAAVAVAEAIEDQCRLRVAIRWPNDLVVDDRKVAGILVESRPTVLAAAPVVVGVGINCTQAPEAFPPAIRPDVTSLAMLGEEVDRTLLARSLLDRLDRAIRCMSEAGGVTDLHQRAAERCATLGKRLVVIEGGRAFRGEVICLELDYGLVLRLEEGGVRCFQAMTTHVAKPGSAGCLPEKLA